MQPNLRSVVRKNPDGSWTTIGSLTITAADGGQIQLGPGVTFTRGVAFMGVDLAAWFDANY